MSPVKWEQHTFPQDAMQLPEAGPRGTGNVVGLDGVCKDRDSAPFLLLVKNLAKSWEKRGHASGEPVTC